MNTYIDPEFPHVIGLYTESGSESPRLVIDILRRCLREECEETGEDTDFCNFEWGKVEGTLPRYFGGGLKFCHMSVQFASAEDAQRALDIWVRTSDLILSPDSTLGVHKCELVHGSEADSDPEPEPEPESKPETEHDYEHESEHESESDSGFESEPDRQFESDLELESEPEHNAEPELEAKHEHESEFEHETDVEHESDVEHKAEPENATKLRHEAD